MNKTSKKPGMPGNNSGFSVIKVVFGLLMAVIVISVSVVAFYEGRKAYWDYRVQEMCNEKGGVFVKEKVKIKKDQIKLMGTVGGYISIPLKSSNNMKYPVYYVYEEVVIRESSPRVTKWEEKIYRRSDTKIVAVIVRFKRSGGDFPSHSHSSSFSCPENKKIYRDRERMFIIQGG